MECLYWRNVEYFNLLLWSCVLFSILRRYDGDLFKGIEMKLLLIVILEWVFMFKEEFYFVFKKNNNNVYFMVKFDED